jgi:FKBP12-rapamycin complex-associated protein
MQCRAYAKALHYKEAEFHESPTAQVLESLISINNKLQQKEAAAGLLEYAMKKHEGEIRVGLQERWHDISGYISISLFFYTKTDSKFLCSTIWYT